MSEVFHDGRVILHAGDCLAVLDSLPENSIDAICTDPPYHLTSIVKRFGGKNAAGAKDYSGENDKATGAYARASRGFMGKQWDGGDIAFNPELWAKVLRVLKPGGHLVAFSGTRTYHRMAVAIEDAGFEIRDQLAWAYGSGFPKSHDVSKAIDKTLGCERGKIRIDASQVRNQKATGAGRDGMQGATRPWIEEALEKGYHEAASPEAASPEAASPEAASWSGWGTALKPAWESICFAQKPHENLTEIDIIGSNLRDIGVALWSMLSASAAAKNSALRPQDLRAEMCASVPPNAELLSNIRDALSGQMDTSLFESAMISSLNTVSLWSGIWAESSKGGSTSTIETELNTTMTLGTLRFLVSRITPKSIILAHKTGQWSNANAGHAERSFAAIAARLSGTLELSALANAIAKEADNCRDAGVTPNWEPICLARKPLDGTVAENVLRWGSGALNIDATRIEGTGNKTFDRDAGERSREQYRLGTTTGPGIPSDIGRWPANICHDGSPEVVAMFPNTTSGTFSGHRNEPKTNGVYGAFELRDEKGHVGDSGSAARFFYSAKADATDRAFSKHPTVKPVALMRWLVRMVTPPDGTVLDPFAGTGTTGHAALLEGFNAVLIEREAEYQADIRRRMSLVFAGSIERASMQEAAPAESLPLFGNEITGGAASRLIRQTPHGLETTRKAGPHDRADRIEEVTR